MSEIEAIISVKNDLEVGVSVSSNLHKQAMLTCVVAASYETLEDNQLWYPQHQ